MEQAILENTIPVAVNDLKHTFWKTNKVRDEYLPSVFGAFFKKLGLPNSMNKSDYSQLAALLSPDEIDHEIVAGLDRIANIAAQASAESG